MNKELKKKEEVVNYTSRHPFPDISTIRACELGLPTKAKLADPSNQPEYKMLHGYSVSWHKLEARAAESRY